MFWSKNRKFGDIRLSELIPRNRKMKNLVGGCLAITLLIICAILYIIITNIKWILLAVVIWVSYLGIQHILTNIKNKNIEQESEDKYIQIK